MYSYSSTLNLLSLQPCLMLTFPISLANKSRDSASAAVGSCSDFPGDNRAGAEEESKCKRRVLRIA